MNKSVILFPLIPVCGMAGKSKLAIREGSPAPERAANSPGGWLGLGLRGLAAAPRGLPANTLLTAELLRLLFAGAIWGFGRAPTTASIPAPGAASARGSSKSGNALPTERGRNVLGNLRVLVPQSPPEKPVSNGKPRGLC